jgi:hypothetical protein
VILFIIDGFDFNLRLTVGSFRVKVKAQEQMPLEGGGSANLWRCQMES